jgi:3-oxoacyl-[acyl-carrier-protein] synthase-1
MSGMARTPFAISDFSLATCLGTGRAANLAALQEGRSGLTPCRFEDLPFAAFTGEIAGIDDAPITGALAGFDCRNNRAAAMALGSDGFAETVAAARARYGASRIGIFAGTSTSGLLQTEHAYHARDKATGMLPECFDYARTHNTYSLARYLREVLGLAGPAVVVSTACASTAKVFANAARMIAAGFCDAAIIGGADTVCATTLFGFASLGVMAPQPCRPFDAARNGISIGEAAGFVLLERPHERHGTETILLLGSGETADAYHMSAPHPEGEGARQAMALALAEAGLQPADIGYINLHGTATLAGDAAEDRAVSGLFGGRVPCSSTKGATGHTLGASGVIEAIFSTLAIQHGFLPGSPQTQTLDPAFRSRYVLEPRTAPVDRVMSNSFGFGGVNCSLILGRAG